MVGERCGRSRMDRALVLSSVPPRELGASLRPIGAACGYFGMLALEGEAVDPPGCELLRRLEPVLQKSQQLLTQTIL